MNHRNRDGGKLIQRGRRFFLGHPAPLSADSEKIGKKTGAWQSTHLEIGSGSMLHFRTYFSPAARYTCPAPRTPNSPWQRGQGLAETIAKSIKLG